MNFSVIIPTLNEEGNITRCLDSLLALEWSRDDFEVIVVDNGSSDRTAALASARGAKVLVRPKASISALRNRGASAAGGDILAFLDADCTVHPGWLREASRYLTRHDVACFGSPPAIAEHATWVQRAWFMVRRKKGASEVPWLESMNMFVRRELFTKSGGFDEALRTCEDYDLSVRLSRSGRILSDERIAAVHHGEAATVAAFIRKEYWRGSSNWLGARRHGFLIRELPSLLFPLVHLVAAAGICGSLIAAAATVRRPHLLSLLLLAGWQIPLAILALLKCGRERSVLLMLQLHLLLNAYFAARGSALLAKHEG